MNCLLVVQVFVRIAIGSVFSATQHPAASARAASRQFPHPRRPHARPLRRAPQTGDTIVFSGWRFEITAMDERRVQTARMTREPTPEDHS
jgi:hypothetical protein